jgi:hypothetical protein
MRVPTGHAYRRSDDRGDVWHAKYRPPDGGQVMKRIGPAWTSRGPPAAGYSTKRTAEAWPRNLLDEARRGTLPGMVRTGATLAEAAAEYLRWIDHDRAASPRPCATTSRSSPPTCSRGRPGACRRGRGRAGPRVSRRSIHPHAGCRQPAVARLHEPPGRHAAAPQRARRRGADALQRDTGRRVGAGACGRRHDRHAVHRSPGFSANDAAYWVGATRCCARPRWKRCATRVRAPARPAARERDARRARACGGRQSPPPGTAVPDGVRVPPHRFQLAQRIRLPRRMLERASSSPRSRRRPASSIKAT